MSVLGEPLKLPICMGAVVLDQWISATVYTQLTADQKFAHRARSLEKNNRDSSWRLLERASERFSSFPKERVARASRTSTMSTCIKLSATGIRIFVSQNLSSLLGSMNGAD